MRAKNFSAEKIMLLVPLARRSKIKNDNQKAQINVLEKYRKPMLLKEKAYNRNKVGRMSQI